MLRKLDSRICTQSYAHRHTDSCTPPCLSQSTTLTTWQSGCQPHLAGGMTGRLCAGCTSAVSQSACATQSGQVGVVAVRGQVRCVLCCVVCCPLAPIPCPSLKHTLPSNTFCSRPPLPSLLPLHRLGRLLCAEQRCYCCCSRITTTTTRCCYSRHSSKV